MIGRQLGLKGYIEKAMIKEIIDMLDATKDLGEGNVTKYSVDLKQYKRVPLSQLIDKHRKE